MKEETQTGNFTSSNSIHFFTDSHRHLSWGSSSSSSSSKHRFIYTFIYLFMCLYIYLNAVVSSSWAQTKLCCNWGSDWDAAGDLYKQTEINKLTNQQRRFRRFIDKQTQDWDLSRRFIQRVDGQNKPKKNKYENKQTPKQTYRLTNKQEKKQGK